MQMRILHGARWDAVVVLIIVIVWAIASAKCQVPLTAHCSRTTSANVAPLKASARRHPLKQDLGLLTDQKSSH